MPNEELKAAMKEIAVKVLSSPQAKEVIANIQEQLQDRLNEVMMPKPKRTAKKKTAPKVRTVTIHKNHMAALEDCADMLDELLQGPLTPELIENAQEAIEALEEFGDSDEDDDEDEQDPDEDEDDDQDRQED